MAKKNKEEEQCGNWMDTYGDMVTLLLTFFVMLFSMSSVNEDKWEKWVKAFARAADAETDQVVLAPEGEGDELGTNQSETPAEGDALANEIDLEKSLPEDFDELFQYLKLYVEQNGMEGSVEVSKQEGCVYIRFQDNIFFNPDSALLKAGSVGILEFLGKCLKNVEDQILTININGHTADPGLENYRVSDWTLSGERASSVAIYLEDQMGLDPKKLLPIGYGKNFPIATNDTPEGREQNRRVDMMIISTKSSLTNEEMLKSILEGTFDTSKYPEEGSTQDVLVPPSSSEAAETQSQVQSPAEQENSSGSSSETASSEESAPEPPTGEEEPANNSGAALSSQPAASSDSAQTVSPYEDA